MQFRELSSSELEEGYRLLSTLRIDLTEDDFLTYIVAQHPQTYRPIGAYQRGELAVYAGVSIHENFELGRYLLIDDLVASENHSHHIREMVDYLCDYAKMHKCKSIIAWGKQRGLQMGDLKEFRPKRDGFIKIL
ncbi:MAG: hypothetical protein Q8N01_10975 [Sulfuricurvum sp.]|nr:hypothetical protein [Sulfuricurvum sp.]MDP3022667.1 hypothetical protein [Sulfuricurvum sp.]MDP3120929.1 hypothetical protein [Sulfuricurvum sp.]